MILTKNDKSTKGDWDKPIVPLCELINMRTDMYTASTCSGRISILKKDPSKKKQEQIWLYVTHDLANNAEISDLIGNYSGKELLYFKQESVIMHIVTKTLSLAKQLMHIAKESGFTKTGIISIQDTGVTVELICAYHLYCPIFDSQLLVTREYLNYLVESANSQLRISWNVIETFKLKIQDLTCV